MMKYLALLAATASIVYSGVTDQKPGQCTAGKDCPTGYSCVSVYSSIPGISSLQQCVPSPICSGNGFGACPSFSSWPENYRNVQPICVINPNVTNCRQDADTRPINETVDCYKFTAVNVLNQTQTKDVQGIYLCQDLSVYNVSGEVFEANREANVKACVGSGAPSLLCNGHGTCGPKSTSDQSYKCWCNKGYSSDDNCLKPTDNTCNNLGQCGAQGQCDTSASSCKCAEGTIGNQCSQCDASSSKACGGHGTCQNGVCKCKDSWTGTFCTEGGENNLGIHLGYTFPMISIVSLLIIDYIM